MLPLGFEYKMYVNKSVFVIYCNLPSIAALKILSCPNFIKPDPHHFSEGIFNFGNLRYLKNKARQGLNKSLCVCSVFRHSFCNCVWIILGDNIRETKKIVILRACGSMFSPFRFINSCGNSQHFFFPIG